MLLSSLLLVGCDTGARCEGSLDGVSVAPTDVATFADVVGDVDGDIEIRATAPDVPDVVVDLSSEGGFRASLRGLRGSTDYTVRVRAEDASCESPLTTGELSGAPPWFEVMEDTAEFADYLMVAYYAVGDLAQGIAIIDREGGPVWNWSGATLFFGDLLASGLGVWAVESPPATSSVEERAWNGDALSAYDVQDAHHSGTSKVPGVAYAVLVSETRTWPDLGTGCGFDTDLVKGDAIVEVGSDGTQTLVWSSFDDLPAACHAQMTVMTSEGDPLDWSHANALDYDPGSDRWLVSLYWLGWIVAVDRGSRAVAWSAGPEDLATCHVDLTHQHGAEFTDSGFAVFDNGHEGGARVARYDVDATTLACTLAEEYVQPEGRNALSMGDVDTTSDGVWYSGWGDIGEIAVIDEGDLEDDGDASLRWRARPTDEYSDAHGGVIVESVAAVVF